MWERRRRIRGEKWDWAKKVRKWERKKEIESERDIKRKDRGTGKRR